MVAAASLRQNLFSGGDSSKTSFPGIAYAREITGWLLAPHVVGQIEGGRHPRFKASAEQLRFFSCVVRRLVSPAPRHQSSVLPMTSLKLVLSIHHLFVVRYWLSEIQGQSRGTFGVYNSFLCIGDAGNTGNTTPTNEVLTDDTSRSIIFLVQ